MYFHSQFVHTQHGSLRRCRRSLEKIRNDPRQKYRLFGPSIISLKNLKLTLRITTPMNPHRVAWATMALILLLCPGTEHEVQQFLLHAFYACMWVCTCMIRYVCGYRYVDIDINVVNINVYINVNTHMYICLYTYSLYVCIYTHRYIYKYTYAFHMYIYIYMYNCIEVYTYTITQT